MGFCKKALMPTSRPVATRLASFIALIMMIFTSESMAWMRLLHSMPSASGRFMSIVMMLGCVSPYKATASAAVFASAHTSKFVLARCPRIMARLIFESSTIITLTFSTKLTCFSLYDF